MTITIIGLGPGGANLLTRQAWQALEAGREVYLRTRLHPAVAELPPHLALHSFDDLYENGVSSETVYSEIIERVLALGRRPEGVLYAVPGHPFVAEAIAPEIVRRARADRLPVRVIDGLSFLEPVFSALGIDPYPNLALIDGLELAAAHMPNFPPSVPALIAQIHSRRVAADVKLTLANVYPDDHPVRLVHAAGAPQQVVEDLALNEIDHSPYLGWLTCLYLPPLGVETAFEAFQEVVARLRAPDGCPWDREQTHRSLRSDTMEEAYEVLSALDADDVDGMREELGDLLFHVIMHAQIAMDNGEFTMADVLRGIHTKLVRRHPHVFGDVAVKNTSEVLQNWERLKAQERQDAGKTRAGVLDGLPAALPALAQAAHYQKRAARVGFDWPDVKGPLDKLAEEIEEVRQSHGAQTADEIGDLLFSVVNLARWYKVDPESALRETNLRFKRRFGYVEAAARAAGRPLTDYSLEELDALWEEGKRELG